MTQSLLRTMPVQRRERNVSIERQLLLMDDRLRLDLSQC